MSKIGLELSDVLLSISVYHMSLAMHLAVEPLPSVVVEVCLDLDAVTLNFVIVELAFVNCATSKPELTLSVLVTTFELTFVIRPVWPFSASKAMLFVFMPLAFVLNSICVHISAFSLSFIAYPLSNINISIPVVESSRSLNLVILEHAFILYTIQLSLNSEAISLFAKPIAFIYVTIG